jgi:hypothetical protein
MGFTQEAIDHHADPHPKRALRIQAFDEMFHDGALFDPEDPPGHKVWYKAKKDEWAKSKKYMRAIGDLGCPASLKGFRLTEALKCAMSAYPLFYRGGVIYYCKSPSFAELKFIFEELYNPSHRFFYVYFSDDSCYSFRLPDGRVFKGGADIKQCDGSHGRIVWDAQGWMLSSNSQARRDFTTLTRQCEAPMEVRCCDHPKTKVVLKPQSTVLYSGSTTTTTSNNTAQLAIAVAMAELSDINETSCVEAAAAAGYILKLEMCDKLRDLQFLKHSPVRDDNGDIMPVLNLGVLLRASGSCHGDLPGRGELEPRARAFQSALLQGMYPRTHFPLVDTMRAATGIVRQDLFARSLLIVNHSLSYKVAHASDDPVVHLTSRNIYARYRLTAEEIDFMDNEFACSEFGNIHAHSALTKILFKDYELECRVGPFVWDSEQYFN